MTKIQNTLKGTRKIIHLRDRCIGCGMCAYVSPDYFEMSDEDGLANLKNSKKTKNDYQANIIPGDEEQTQKAADECPVNVIKVG